MRWRVRRISSARFRKARSMSSTAAANRSGSARSTSSILASGTPASTSVLILTSRIACSAPYRRYPDESRGGSGSRPRS